MIREGSWIIVDNGGASGDIRDSTVKAGHRYLTRVKMNASDDLRMKENADTSEDRRVAKESPKESRSRSSP